MPFDETSRRPGRGPSGDVPGGKLDICSARPMTGFFRNGCCDTSAEDFDSHTVCVVMTVEFLAYSKASGNDLSTPHFRPLAGPGALDLRDDAALLTSRIISPKRSLSAGCWFSSGS